MRVCVCVCVCVCGQPSSEEAKKLAAKERLKATNYDLNGLHKFDEQGLEEYFHKLYQEDPEFEGKLFKRNGGRYKFGNFRAHNAGDVSVFHPFFFAFCARARV